MNEKKLHTLTIDPEFRDLIPPLNDEELAMLEESIVANGCESPLIVWNGVIVDGHNRYAVCQKQGIPFAVTEKSFDSREEAMLWMLRNQLGRRNLNSYQRSEMVLKFEPLIRMAAKQRQDQRNDLNDNFVQNSAQSSEAVRSRDQLGKLAGVSHDTIKKVKKLSESADEETKGKLRRGEVTVHKAYTELMQKERPENPSHPQKAEPEAPQEMSAEPADASLTDEPMEIVDVVVEEKPVEIESYRAFRPYMIKSEGNVRTLKGTDHDHLMENPIYRQLFESYTDAVHQVNLARGEMRTRCVGYERRIRSYEESLLALRNENVRLRGRSTQEQCSGTGAEKSKAKDISGQMKPYPVNGMAMLNGAAIHVVTPLPDKPEMMAHVMNVLESGIHEFLATIDTALRLMTKGIATRETLRIFEKTLLDALDRAYEMFLNHVKELESQ